MLKFELWIESMPWRSKFLAFNFMYKMKLSVSAWVSNTWNLLNTESDSIILTLLKQQDILLVKAGNTETVVKRFFYQTDSALWWCGKRGCLCELNTRVGTAATHIETDFCNVRCILGNTNQSLLNSVNKNYVCQRKLLWIGISVWENYLLFKCLSL